MDVDPVEYTRLHQKFGAWTARKIARGTYLRNLVAEMLVDRCWIKLSQVLLGLIEVNFPREEDQP